MNKTVKDMLRQGGYKSMPPGGYHNPNTGHTLYPYNWVNGQEAWRNWEEMGELPQQPQVVKKLRGEGWQISLMSDYALIFDHLPRRMTPDRALAFSLAIEAILKESEGN